MGYYFMLRIISIFYSRKVNKQEFIPEVSLVITAYNEEKKIRQKLENTLALLYPKDRLEIIVVSDGSTDKTEELVSTHRDKGIRLLALSDRHGKHFAQYKGIEVAQYDILVLTDATTFLKEDAVAKIVQNFSDPNIGCISGKDRVKSPEPGLQGEGAYVNYEMKLRALESKLNSLVGVSGSFFAVRKNLCEIWHSDLSSDFYLPILSYMKGYRTVLEPEAIGYYEVLKEPQKEFQRKVRTVVRGLEVLFKFKKIMNPLKYGIYSLQMISHKLFRWLVPICLILLFFINLFLFSQDLFYRILLIMQILFYIVALLAFFVKKLQDIMPFKIPFFFIVVNLSILVAWHNFLIGKRFVIWEPTKR